jgi:hypothetical protein
MRKEKSLNYPPVLPYGEVNVTILPCHPSHEKIDSPPTGEPVRYTRFEEVVSLLEAMMPPSTAAVEPVVVDVIEEPGVTVVTEFEATEVREPTAPRQSEKGQGPAPPASEEP